MTKHPAKAGAQRRVFEQIATGNPSPLADRRTIRALHDAGLIQPLPDKVLGGRFPVRIKQWEVPIPVHMQWCEWCSEQEAAE